MYEKTQGFHEKGSLVGHYIGRAVFFFYCTCTISMKNILETLILL